MPASAPLQSVASAEAAPREALRLVEWRLGRPAPRADQGEGGQHHDDPAGHATPADFLRQVLVVYVAAASAQRALSAPAATCHVPYGRNQPALRHFHRQLAAAVG